MRAQSEQIMQFQFLQKTYLFIQNHKLTISISTAAFIVTWYDSLVSYLPVKFITISFVRKVKNKVKFLKCYLICTMSRKYLMYISGRFIFWTSFLHVCFGIIIFPNRVNRKERCWENINMAIEDHHLRVMSYCYTTHISDM